ncbi:Nuclear elongation and deformation protein 1 [Ceratocystis platani]|uniref:Nuclear elongation and deformation protein 1 n=1 Tax=Ceratocystis fimbriata f. sp. platani TaxID=88771 RepID=A0A0F8CYN6_CERFI|nr:Nuclear elongation and deformation protein 1 [Ceratocystis platani]
MQYVRNLSDSVSTAWNSINPATLSGAIDVIVVEHEDGSLSCSPFHVRFGKFSLLRPFEKKVEFNVNGVKQDYSMKLGEGGEAFFVFETTDNIPQALQTSPLASPAASPQMSPAKVDELENDPDSFNLDDDSTTNTRRSPKALAASSADLNDDGSLTSLSTSPPDFHIMRAKSDDWQTLKAKPLRSDENLRHSAHPDAHATQPFSRGNGSPMTARSQASSPIASREVIDRALTLSRELSAANIPSQITETGDLMLDMTGFKSNEEDVLKAEILARRILSEELDGNYDIGALFGLDEQGNLWIYHSEEAKEAAMKRTLDAAMRNDNNVSADAVSDPGYQSDGSDISVPPHHHLSHSHRRSESDTGPMQLQSRSSTSASDIAPAGDPNRNYAKTLRLTSEQLKALNLKNGENVMSFTVNRATCQAYMFLWKYDSPVVISDIDGTITKSDALGHVLNMIGRDWTHSGIAKLYSDISANGYNIMYLTSRSVGQSDTTRAYLNGIVQDGYRLPRGPTILSPDRTFHALRREIYLRKPHIFKMATLRDIRNLYGPESRPFYAGFGNRLTDQISYRTVDVPRNRIFTINSNSEVSMDLLSLNTLKMTYMNINEVVDHYFPAVSTMVKGGGEEFTDFTYWREKPRDLDEFSFTASEDEGDDEEDEEDLDDEDGDDYMDDEELEDEDEDMGSDASIEEEDEYDDDDDVDDELEHSVHDLVESAAGAAKKAMESSSAPIPLNSVPDVSAQLITGVKNLSVSMEQA